MRCAMMGANEAIARLDRSKPSEIKHDVHKTQFTSLKSCAAVSRSDDLHAFRK